MNKMEDNRTVVADNDMIRNQTFISNKCKNVSMFSDFQLWNYTKTILCIWRRNVVFQNLLFIIGGFENINWNSFTWNYVFALNSTYCNHDCDELLIVLSKDVAVLSCSISVLYRMIYELQCLIVHCFMFWFGIFWVLFYQRLQLAACCTAVPSKNLRLRICRIKRTNYISKLCLKIWIQTINWCCVTKFLNLWLLLLIKLYGSCKYYNNCIYDCSAAGTFPREKLTLWAEASIRAA